MTFEFSKHVFTDRRPKSWGFSPHYHRYKAWVADPCGILHSLDIWFWTTRKSWKWSVIFGEDI